ncbi:hypothetical protein ACRQ1B_14890 [Rhizobium panacihumi]|uniref:hypothetical protein n=1 Tax=Rhizobium panacihumi TaxID=2008450 RepID=UPI003D7A6F1E
MLPNEVKEDASIPAVAEARVLVSARSQSMGALLRAVRREHLAIPDASPQPAAPFDAEHLPLGGNVVVSKTVAAKLGVKPGDTVTLGTVDGIITPFGRMPRIWRFRVTGTTDDTSQPLVYLQASDAEKFLTPGSG